MIARYDARVDARAAIARLDQVTNAAERPKKALEAMADLFFDKIEPQYWRSVRWQPLTPESARRKSKRGRPTTPLTGGALEASLTRRGALYQVREVTEDSVRVGTSDPVARIHNVGSYKAPEANIPRRRLIRLRPNDRAAFRLLMAAHVMGRTGEFSATVGVSAPVERTLL